MPPDEEPEVASDPDQADRLDAALCGDAAFAVVDGEPTAATLEAAIARLDPEQVAIIRIRNPLVAPLSAERVMLQLAPEETDENGLVLDEAGRLLRAVTAGAAGRPCLIVVVEQAETLTKSALSLLQLLPGLQATGGDRVRVVFLGGPAFHALLEDPRFSAIRGDDSELPDVDELPVSYGTGAAVGPSLALARRSSKLRRFAALGAIVLAASAMLVVALRSSHSPETVTAPIVARPLALGIPALPPPPPRDDLPPSLPAGVAAVVPPPPAVTPAVEPPLAPPVAPALLPLSPPAIAEDAAAARARAFAEFNAFVEARGLAGRLSRSNREILFQEYLVRRSKGEVFGSAPTAANGPQATAVSEPPEVLLFFQANAPGMQAWVDQSAAKLRQRVPDVTLRPMPDSLPEPSVRYFRPEDRDVALTLAFALLPESANWKIVDMSGAAGRRARATIEVWLPRPSTAP